MNLNLKVATRSAWLLVIAVVMTTVFPMAAWAEHPYHVSLAEVNWNPKTNRFEVALCVWPADLEKVLRQQTGRPVDLQEEPDVDKLLAEYVSQSFFIRALEPGKTPEKAIAKNADSLIQNPVADSTHGTSTTFPAEPLKQLRPGDFAGSELPQVSGTEQEASPDSNTAKDPAGAEGKTQGPIEDQALAGSTTAPPTKPLTIGKLRWHGYEADAKQAWLYFEIDGQVSETWTFENRIFFELNNDQLNHVQWSQQGKTKTMVVSPQSPTVNLGAGS